jgi:hypothetical protein
MSRSSLARYRRATSALASRRSHCLLHVESLEDRRLLVATSGLSVGTYQLLVDYFRALYSGNPPPYRSLDSLLNDEVEPIVKCPGLRDEFCLPDTVSSGSVDAAMDKEVGLDDDWFSIDAQKQSLLDGGLKWQPE